MRQAAIYSAALHLAVITIAYFGVPALLSAPTVEDQPMSVDLVSLEEVTKPPPEPAPPKPVPPPPQARPAPPPPPPPATTPEPPPQAKPEPPPPVPKPVAKPKPEPVPEPPAARPEPKPRAVSAPPPKRKPVREDQFQALLKNLAKQKEAQQRTRTPPAEAKPAPAATPAPDPRQVARAAIDRQLSARRLTAMVKQQLAPCWNIPGGAKDAQNMRIGVQIRLNTDGTLRGAPHVLDAARMRSDRVFRAVAESAVRALLNPRCSPLKLPYEEYDIWQNITFNFDPGEALGQ